MGLVVGGHLILLAFLTIREDYGRAGPSDERMSLFFVDLPAAPDHVAAPSPHPHASRTSSATLPVIVPAPESPPNESAAISPGIDWYARGADAAQRATTEPTTRDFGLPRRASAPREKKEFGWDKTHTERVHALDGGGIGIHLSDNCELIIAPFPMAGCALGKRKARGDLFDEMKAPVEPGDWQDH